jgi:hypothetical protein
MVTHYSLKTPFLPGHVNPIFPGLLSIIPSVLRGHMQLFHTPFFPLRKKA